MRTRRTWIARAALACLVAGGAAAAQQPDATAQVGPAEAPAARVDAVFVERVLAVLTPLGAGTPPVLEETVAELVRLGPEAVPTLLGFLTGEAQAFADEQRAARGEPEPADGPGWSSRHDVAVLDALGGLPADAVLAELRARATGAAPLEQRLVAMRVLERAEPSVAALDLWLEIALGIEPIHRLRTFVQVPLQGALARLVARDRELLRELRQGARELDPTLAAIVVRAVGEAGHADGLEVLERFAGRWPEVDAEVLTQVAAIGRRLYTGGLDRSLVWIRPMLASDDARTRAQAAETLADLGDSAAIPELIGLLEDSNRRVQKSARAALERMSGLKLGPERKPWTRWYAAECRWLESEGPRLRQQLGARDPSAVVAALGVLSQRRIFRDEMVEVLVRALWRDESEIVAATCLALGQLGSRRAAPYLLDALRDPEDEVRESAWQALKLLTHEDLPLEYELWAQRLEG